MKRLAIVLASVIWAVSSYAQLDYFGLIERADSLVSHAQWDKAEECYMQALRQEPSNPMNAFVMSNVGLVRHYAGNDSRAMDILNTAVAIAPSAVTVRLNRAKVLTAQGRLEEAIKDYDKVLELDSLLIEPRHMLAIIYLSRGDVRAAEREAEHMKAHHPEAAETMEVESYIYLGRNEYSKAIAPLSSLIKKAPTATSYGQRALCYIMTDQLGEAAEDLHEAIRLDPANGELYVYRAMLNKRRYRPADATEDVKRAIELGVSREMIKQLGLI